MQVVHCDIFQIQNTCLNIEFICQVQVSIQVSSASFLGVGAQISIKCVINCQHASARLGQSGSVMNNLLYIQSIFIC